MPHLQTLVERHQDDAFELIGVNTGDSPEAYSAGLETYGVTWLSAYQGAESAIAKMYQVTGYPTYVLIDANGKIRARGHNGEAMDETIAELLAEAKQ
ncbi:MAG: cytochrome oxidase Cu insertion factor (SCO1/SenC/PrrC family) [Planctomycetota bacterium]|jgi:cytochrome oxidase Cu insertion factor (SCO1/SenC/PrrC family)